ncbi:hypothetical protein Zmor_025485 [Zophobas morio]|uniref:Uncharacterized protein n=1 Tax=Zophobas morio TaxID=2755281 RepID=A0AA38M552_9CUCU|nr:hypothetical protein Zmor_025485 [Zophobas morio]
MDDNTQKSEIPEKSLDELKTDLSQLRKKLEISQNKLIRLNQQEEVLQKQEALLKKQAHDLNDRVIVQRVQLETAWRQSEKNVEEFVKKINRALEKKKFGTNGKNQENMEECNERRKRYFELSGEREALLVFKEYQECVLDELQKLNNSRPVEM